MSGPSWVIFTDLDETLLDRERYSFEAARPALEEVRRRGIPLVLCTSKTAAETLHVQGLLGIRESCVVEAGGGVLIPRGVFAGVPEEAEERGGFLLVPLAPRRGEILRVFARLREATQDSIRGFSDMTPAELAAETGLPVDLAGLALQREFDEPFRFVRREAEFALQLPRLAGESGLRISKGGRFYHLHGATDKGRAVKLLQSLYRVKLGEIRTIGVGDSAIDLPLLAAVDLPVAVARADGTHDPELAAGVRNLRTIPERGPAGWNAAILDLIR